MVEKNGLLANARNTTLVFVHAVQFTATTMMITVDVVKVHRISEL